jgi:hypothetical protein
LPTGAGRCAASAPSSRPAEPRPAPANWRRRLTALPQKDGSNPRRGAIASFLNADGSPGRSHRAAMAPTGIIDVGYRRRRRTCRRGPAGLPGALPGLLRCTIRCQQ